MLRVGKTNCCQKSAGKSLPTLCPQKMPCCYLSTTSGFFSLSHSMCKETFTIKAKFKKSEVCPGCPTSQQANEFLTNTDCFSPQAIFAHTHFHSRHSVLICPKTKLASLNKPSSFGLGFVLGLVLAFWGLCFVLGLLFLFWGGFCFVF